MPVGVAAPADPDPVPDADVEGDEGGVEVSADEVSGGEGWAGGVGIQEVSRTLIPAPAASSDAVRSFFKVFS